MRRLIIGGIIVLALLAGGFLLYQRSGSEEAAPAPTIDVNTLAIDTGVGSVSAEGRIVPRDSTVLAFQISGEVAEVLVPAGGAVKKGEPILRLVDTDFQLALEQAATAVLQAEANIQSARAGLVTAEAGLAAARVGVEAAEAQLALVQSGATEAQVDLSEAQLAAAEAGVVQAAGQRDAALEGATTAQIQAAEAQLAAARAQVVPLQLRVDQLARGELAGTDDDKRNAQLQLNAALAAVKAAEAALADARAGARTPEQQAANSAVAAAAANRDAAGARLSLVQAGARPEDVVLARTGVDQARNRVAEAELTVRQAEVGIAAAEAGLQEVQKALAAAESALAKTRLVAPFDAVVASVSPKVGEVVVAGTPAVTLADFGRWRVETTDLTELSVVSVAVGYPVEISVDAFTGETLSGRVVDIAPVSDIVLGDVTYKITIDIDDDGGLPLRWGMTAFVSVDVEQ